MDKGIVYRVTNNINGKCYIGQTIQPFKRRKKQHMKNSLVDKWCSYFHNALCKYGNNNFIWEVLSKNNNIRKLNDIEKFYIGYYNALAPNGYNLTIGGNNGKRSAKTKERCRKAQIKYHEEHPEAREMCRIKTIEYFKNPDAREKARINTIKQFNDPESRENHKLSQIKRFENPEVRKEISRIKKEYFKKHPEVLAKMADRSRKYFSDPETRKKMSRKLKEYYKNNISEALEKRKKAVIVMDVRYDSISEASRETGISRASLGRWINIESEKYRYYQHAK